jgi:N6-L-threonylcarbamoyladenine synthase
VFLNPEAQEPARPPAVPDFPYVALLASGGHTSIYHVKNHCEMSCLGQTLDDAAGEAFDKVSKMMGLGYPGGSAIAGRAETGRPGRMHFPRAYMDKSAYDFSFSGIKTAVKRFIQTHPADCPDLTGDIAAEFQDAVTEVLVHKLMHAAEDTGCKDMAVVGGVAANQQLRRRMAEAAAGAGRRLFIPSVDLCGDNAAMVAGLGYHWVHTDRAGAQARDLAMDVYSRAARR